MTHQLWARPWQHPHMTPHTPLRYFLLLAACSTFTLLFTRPRGLCTCYLCHLEFLSLDICKILVLIHSDLYSNAAASERHLI